MPFGLKLKKSRHYNVMSKSLFVISVDHLDSSTKIDCTLSSESTGQECLDNVCQRISIQQPEFFGLRYVVKGTNDEMRWVDLERPLSRQLEKYSANSKVLHLRVMYYVLSGVSLIQDEGTRNYYFLQLKHDVVEGRISCDPRQAVILANYSRQAEYGNHQDRHTVEYLKTLLAFPHEMVRANLLEALTEQVIQQAHELHNVTQGDAESLYISACQQLDGYGQETFTAKNETGLEVMLGISVSGIIVASDTNKFYPWRDITNVVNHKRAFNIECTVAQESAGFTVADVATGRYIWKLCALQHRFFVTYEQNQIQASEMNLNLFQNMADNLNDSRDDLLNEQQYVHGQQQQQQQQQHQPSPSPGGSQHPYQGSTNQLAPSTTSWPSTHELAAHSANMWNNAMVDTQPGGGGHLSSSNATIATGAGGGSSNNLNANSIMQSSRSSLQQASSGLDINLNSSTNNNNAVPLEYASSGLGSSWGLHPAGSNASLINRAQSSSCLDLSNNNLTPDRDRLKALLPTYRPAPDYETAIQQKYRSSSNDVRLVNGSLLHLSASQMLANAQEQHQQTAPHHLEYSITGSQPDVSYYGQHLQQSQQQQQPQQQVHQQPYPDVTHHTTTHIIGPHYSDASEYGMTHRFKMMRLPKPPPPYPANRLSSTSTPDLASHRALLGLRSAQVSGSSPDLVSSRPLLAHHPHLHHLQHHAHQQQHHAQHPIAHHLSQSGQLFAYNPQHHPQQQQLHHSQTMLPHGTYENLNFIEPTKPTGMQPAGSVYYYVPGGVEHLLISSGANANTNSGSDSPSSYHHNTANGHALGLATKHLHRSSQHINGSIEPIYENVPLPWKSEGDATMLGEIRNRTASVQSAPGVQQPAMRPIPATPSPPQPQTPTNTNAPAMSFSALNQQEVTGPPTAMVREHKKLQQQARVVDMAPPPGPSPSARTSTDSAPGQSDGGAGKLSAKLTVGGVENSLNSSTSTVSSVAKDPSPPTPINRSLSSNNVLEASQYSNLTLNETGQSAGGTVGGGSVRNGHNDSGISSITGSTNLGGSVGGSTASRHQPNVAASAMTAPYASSSSPANSTTVSATSTSSVKETKRRRIWEILGGRSKQSSDKQKSATLGREKDRKKKGNDVGGALGGTGGSGGSGGSANSSLNEGANGGQLRHRWSTGLPRLQPLPANISKEKLCSLLESKLADPQLYCEFERIPKRSDSATYSCALAEDNKNKNFDPTFLPYDNNRVRLTPTRDNRMGYVNASHITSTVGNKQRFYIVAESPNDTLTTHIFWQCVWEADVYLLVQLSKELNYIPQTSERCLEYGQYQVWREFSQETDRCTTSKLRVYHTQSRRYRSVWHLSYTEWADQNCPGEVGHFLGFLEELNSVRLASIAEVPPSHNTNPPVLIHCNEGGGRTGVTLVADLLLYTLDHNQDIDIPRLIGQIRQQRDNIIPSLAQYKFIHALLIHYLKQNRLI
ncbi:tyrosine-protein phosphatase non-receptor type 14 [Anopheles ziemanni]|uniref:tyrosine-protein phosphatase non-receptor type 14 n=1 Tax=Anopheles coustani TaxID=139045 RepID=UPI00265B3178|nr:tyrosine-protein phosphatase non-receptor type 14 [Anopheles coustani]XP_058120168.1 tyrosine-protein phosphatase non-receptor type 14 [Anopheles coustani]XP_058167276.1 tyrosine-protein phosphatase non-receptor type 14 [Anopheles ziemanni]